MPGEGNTGVFDGNSNWRGPVWFPISDPLYNALERYEAAYGDAFRVKCPTGSGQI